jgi:hypothetical protein
LGGARARGSWWSSEFGEQDPVVVEDVHVEMLPV